MAYQLNMVVDFGDVYSGVSGVGYRLIDYTGATVTARTTGSIINVNKGAYSSLVSIPDGFKGVIVWDVFPTALASGYAVESINPQTGEYIGTMYPRIDVNTSSRIASGASININLNQYIPAAQNPGTVGRALQIARAQGRGNWVIDANTNTLTVYDTDGTTVIGIFTLYPGTPPYSQRTVSNDV